MYPRGGRCLSQSSIRTAATMAALAGLHVLRLMRCPCHALTNPALWLDRRRNVVRRRSRSRSRMRPRSVVRRQSPSITALGFLVARAHEDSYLARRCVLKSDRNCDSRYAGLSKSFKRCESSKLLDLGDSVVDGPARTETPRVCAFRTDTIVPCVLELHRRCSTTNPGSGYALVREVYHAEFCRWRLKPPRGCRSCRPPPAQRRTCEQWTELLRRTP